MGASGSFLSIESLSEYEISDSLNPLGSEFVQYKAMIVDNKIDGKYISTLKDLTSIKKFLRQLGIGKPNHVKSLCEHLLRLQQLNQPSNKTMTTTTLPQNGNKHIFLSYHILDKALVEQMAIKFDQLGWSVYRSEIDPVTLAIAKQGASLSAATISRQKVIYSKESVREIKDWRLSPLNESQLQEEKKEAIRLADTVVFCCSEHYNQSEQCREEAAFIEQEYSTQHQGEGEGEGEGEGGGEGMDGFSFGMEEIREIDKKLKLSFVMTNMYFHTRSSASRSDRPSRVYGWLAELLGSTEWLPLWDCSQVTDTALRLAQKFGPSAKKPAETCEMEHIQRKTRPPRRQLTRETRDFDYSRLEDTQGLFYYLGCGGRPQTESYTHPCWRKNCQVVCSRSSNFEGDPQDLICRSHSMGESETISFTDNLMYSWMMVDIGAHRRLMVSYYSLRHGGPVKGGGEGEGFLRCWSLQGSMDGKQFFDLKKHSNDKTLRRDRPAAAWEVPPPSHSHLFPPEASDGFRFFRVLVTGQNSSRCYHLWCSGMELYGRLTFYTSDLNEY